MPYHLNYYKELFALIQKNKPRLIHSFPNLLRETEAETTTKDFIQQKIFDWNKNKAYAFLVFEKKAHTLIGHFNIKDIDWKKREADLGYFIDVDFEGKGMMTEAINAVLNACFVHADMNKITAKVATTNSASIRVLQKAGMKYEGALLKNHRTYGDTLLDTNSYGLSREDFINLIKRANHLYIH